MVAAQVIGRTEARIVRVVRCEIVKPLNCSWDELGRLLRGLRTVMHRLLNAAVLANLDAHRKIIDTPPQTAGAQAIRQSQRLAGITLPSVIIDELTTAATAAYKRWKKSNGNDAIPSFRKGQPISVRATGARVGEGERGPTLSVKLTAGNEPWVDLALAPSSGRHHEIMRNLARKKHGFDARSIKLDYDERRKKWYALIAYSYPKPPPHPACDPDRVLVLHRGAHNFLVAMSSDGKFTTVARGGKLMATKRKLKARRDSAKRISAGERGNAASGHGTARRYETHEAFLDKEARVVKTFCQQVAARARDLAIQWGCGRVVIGDYGGIEPHEDRAVRRFVPHPPLYQLKMAIGCALEPLSIVAEEVSEAYVSQLCPRCDSLGGRHQKLTGIFHCLTCGFDWPADKVSALHMLRRAEPKENVHDKRLEDQYKLEKKLREAQGSQAENEAEESADSTAQTRGQCHSRTGPERVPDLLGTSQEIHDPPLRSRPAASQLIGARKPRRKGAERKGAPKAPRDRR